MVWTPRGDARRIISMRYAHGPEENAGSAVDPEWTGPNEAPELTDKFFAHAEVFEGEKFVRRGPGRPPTGNARELISVRLDRDILAKLREAGPGWQSQINLLLRDALNLNPGTRTETVGLLRAMEELAHDGLRKAEKAAAAAAAVC